MIFSVILHYRHLQFVGIISLIAIKPSSSPLTSLVEFFVAFELIKLSFAIYIVFIAVLYFVSQLPPALFEVLIIFLFSFIFPFEFIFVDLFKLFALLSLSYTFRKSIVV